MGMFGSMGRAAAMMPYDDLMRQLQQQGGAPVVPPQSTPGIGDGLPRNLPAAPTGMFGGGSRPAMAGNATPNSQPSGPDYGSHYMMHGRDEHGAFPAGPKRSLGQKILKGVGDFALAWAASNGDPMAQQTMQMRMKQRAGRQQAEAEFQQHNSLVQNLMRRGINADDAELYALNPEKLSEEMNSRFRTREASEGETIRTPGMGSQPDQAWTAPKTFTNGPDVVRYDPQSNTAAPIYQGLTDAQRALAESGIQPGSPEAYRFLQDLHLNGQGPTAVDMQRDRLGQSDLNSRRSTGVSRENSIRSNATSRYNAGNTPLAPVLNQSSGEVMVPFRNGRVGTIPNSMPLAGRGGGRGGRGSSPAPSAGGTRIRNPRTGETMVLRNGQWVKE